MPPRSLMGTDAVACFYPFLPSIFLTAVRENMENVNETMPLVWCFRTKSKFLTMAFAPSSSHINSLLSHHDLLLNSWEVHSHRLEFSSFGYSQGSLFCFIWPLFQCKVLRWDFQEHPTWHRSPPNQTVAWCLTLLFTLLYLSLPETLYTYTHTYRHMCVCMPVCVYVNCFYIYLYTYCFSILSSFLLFYWLPLVSSTETYSYEGRELLLVSVVLH